MGYQSGYRSTRRDVNAGMKSTANGGCQIKRRDLENPKRRDEEESEGARSQIGRAGKQSEAVLMLLPEQSTKEGTLRIQNAGMKRSMKGGQRAGKRRCACGYRRAQGRKWQLYDSCGRDAEEAPCFCDANNHDFDKEHADADPLTVGSCSAYHNKGAHSRSNPYEDSGHATDVEAWPWPVILERLSVRKQCQLRVVSKTWNLMLGEAAHRLCKVEECWFVMIRPPRHGQNKWKFMAYSTHSRDFFRPPLPNASHGKLFSLLGGEDCCRLARRLPDWRRKPPLICNLQLRSAGGLMSAIVRKPHGFDIIVFNCVTGSVEVLPPPLAGDELSIGDGCFLNMILDSQNPGCFIVMLTPDFTPGYLEIFESRNGCWKVGRDLIHTSFPSDLKVLDGDFFWLLSQPEGCRTRVVAYHLVHDAWSSLSVPEYPKSFHLHKYGGRLFLILALWGKGGISCGFGVWKHQLTSAQTGTWVEVARTPEHLWPSLSSHWNCYLYASGNLFWMAPWTLKRLRSFRPPLIFDMAQMSWHSLWSERISRKFCCILVYRPSFHA